MSLKMFNVFNDIPQIPKWLEDFLKTGNTEDMTIMEYGEQALLAKQIDVELENNAGPQRHQRKIPEQITMLEASILMMYRFKFFNVYTDKGHVNTQLAMYIESGEDKGIYSTNIDLMEKQLFRIAPTFEIRHRKEVLANISLTVPDVGQTEHADLVPVNNGVFDKKAQELRPFSPKFVFLSKLGTNYNPDAKKPLYTFSDGVQWTPDELFQVASDDPETEKLLWQVASDFFQPNFTREKSIFFYSEKGNNGKGTFGTLLESIAGENNVAHLAVDDLNHEFLKESLIGKVGNIAHENNVNDYIDNVRDFKALVTGDNITVNRKYEKPISFQFKGTNIQMFNGLPKTKDKSASFYRRLLLIPFTRSFTNNGQRPDIKNVFIHQTDVKEYVLRKALQLQFTEFIEPSQSKLALEHYQTSNDPVIEFWEEMEDEFVWDLLPTTFLYDLFVEYFKRNNPSGRPISRQSFLSQLKIHLDGDVNWDDKSDKKVWRGSHMDKDEPLITEYNLTRWMDQTYRGNDLAKLRDFPKSQNYRGFTRK